jgi:hypothetical protein
MIRANLFDWQLKTGSYVSATVGTKMDRHVLFAAAAAGAAAI